MNPYLTNLNKIEFVVTYACTGRCKHCSEGEHASFGERIRPEAAVDALCKVAKAYPIQTVMTFGGEPLLYPEVTYAIHRAARDMGVSKRQVITNGYFSKHPDTLREVARGLADCGVNDLLLSVDAFHQETIPWEAVRFFAAEAKACGLPIRLQPAWLRSESDENPYNRQTRAILQAFADMEIPVGSGNVVFPEGNALKYLSAYFDGTPPENPYTEDPRDLRCLSFSPDGGVLDGNIYREDIMQILRCYHP